MAEYHMNRDGGWDAKLQIGWRDSSYFGKAGAGDYFWYSCSSKWGEVSVFGSQHLQCSKSYEY